MKPHVWNVAAGTVLLLAACMLYAAMHHLGYYHSHEHYFTRPRNVVCAAWVFAGIRFYVYKGWPAVIVSAVITILFNPVVPVIMSRDQWLPYDIGTIVCSSVAASVLIFFLRRPIAGGQTPTDP